MLGHLSFGVSDLERCKAFYDAALAPRGLARVWTKGDAAGYGPPGRGDLLALKKRSAAAVPPGPGFPSSFQCSVTLRGRHLPPEGLKAGGIDNGAPGLGPHYGPRYYAACAHGRLAR